MGDWKYVFGSRELFDLAADRAEQKNVAASHPEIIQRMEAIIARNHDPDLFTKNPRKMADR